MLISRCKTIQMIPTGVNNMYWALGAKKMDYLNMISQSLETVDNHYRRAVLLAEETERLRTRHKFAFACHYVPGGRGYNNKRIKLNNTSIKASTSGSKGIRET